MLLLRGGVKVGSRYAILGSRGEPTPYLGYEGYAEEQRGTTEIPTRAS